MGFHCITDFFEGDMRSELLHSECRAECYCFLRHVLAVRDFGGPCIIICYVRTAEL